LPRTGFSPTRAAAVRAPWLALAAVGLLTTLAAGCSSPANSTSAPVKPVPGTCLSGGAAPLTIVVGERSNVPGIQFPGPVNTMINTAAVDKQQITLIRIDGKPSVMTLQKFSTEDQNSGAVSDDIAAYVSGVDALVDGPKMHAVTAQADVLSALSYAAAATPAGGNIIVIDSGLQTAGQLQYQAPGMLMSPPSDVVSFLKEKGLIPSLAGRHVLLSGFGYTAAPQAVLDQPERQNVAAQWAAIVKAGGACVTVDPTPNTNKEIPGLPAVATVPLPATPVFKSCGTTVLSDAGTVGFNVGLSSFRDPAEARQTLSKLATVLMQGTEPIRLIGSTSSEGGDAINDPLSLNRAKAVESVLVSLGVPAGRITVVGDGAHYPGRVADLGAGGQLLLPQAEQDREVIVQLPQCQGAGA
jgi:OmpA-OmpF porin, OOP family